MSYSTEEIERIVNDYHKLLKSSGWKPMETKDGCAWFGGKGHHTLSEYLPDDALKHNHEDIDFLVVGWRTYDA